MVKILLPDRKHVCLRKVKNILRSEWPNHPFSFSNDHQVAAAAVCHDCIERSFWMGNCTKKYFDSDNEVYYSVIVSNRIKKFDVGGAKKYFMKNVDTFLPVILTN